MERGDWARLPGGLFTRGYLRAYAREVGLDGEALVAQFRAEHEPAPSAAPEAEAASRLRESKIVGWPRGLPMGRVWRGLTWPALGLALLLATYLAASRPSPDEQAAPGPSAGDTAVAGQANSLGALEPRAIGTAAREAAGNQQAPAAPDDTSRVPSAEGDIPLPLPDSGVPITMDLSVTRPCWVTVTADGARRIYRIVRPGEHEQVQGSVLRLRVGDAAALQLSLDGQVTSPLGTPGEVRTIDITRDNYRSLLPPISSPSLNQGPE